MHSHFFSNMKGIRPENQEVITSLCCDKVSLLNYKLILSYTHYCYQQLHDGPSHWYI